MTENKQPKDIDSYLKKKGFGGLARIEIKALLTSQRNALIKEVAIAADQSEMESPFGMVINPKDFYQALTKLREEA